MHALAHFGKDVISGDDSLPKWQALQHTSSNKEAMQQEAKP